MSNARGDVDRPLRRAHHAATREAEIDLGRLRMAVVRTHLPGLPAGNRYIASTDFAQNLLDMTIGIPLLFLFKLEYEHSISPHG